jgi:CHAT domain-containing protein
MKKILILVLILFTSGGCASKAQYYYSKGNHADMIREFDRKGGFKKVESTDLFYLCSSCLAMRQYQKSIDCASEMETRDSVMNSMGQYYSSSIFKSTAYLTKLQTYIDTGEFTMAMEYGEKAYAILAQQSSLARFSGMDHIGINITGDLGIALALSGNRGRATEMLKELENYPMSILRTHVLKPYRQLKVIQIAFALKNYDDVINLCDRHKDLFEERWWSELPGHRFAYSRLTMDFIRAKSYFESGRLETADSLYSILLKTPHVEESSDIYFYSLTDLGLIRLNQGKNIEGIELLRKAVEVMELQRSSITSESAKIGFVGDKQAVYGHLIAALYEDRQYEKSFEYVERAKARALVDILASKRDFTVRGGNEQEIRTALAMNETADREASIEDIAIDKAKTRSIQIKTKEELRNKAPELASLVSVTSQDASEIQSLIPEGEALVEYYYRDNNMFVFIISDGKLRALKLDGGGIAGDVEVLRKVLESPGSERYVDLSGKLYQRIFAPIEGALGKNQNIMIVPHGTLHYIPFAALHDGRRFLIERYNIRTMPSSSAIKYLREGKAGRGKGVLIFGNPDIGEPKYDLEYAGREAGAIAALRPQSRLFLRKDATEGALRRYATSFNYIHFATHGQFNADSPLKSALLLTPDSQYNGLLTVDKLYTLDLDADLVTLSACETGLSKVANGDDLVGLTRGFLYAGSSSIVASLWKVDDMATADLMKIFYMQMEKTNKRDALRNAQLETKKQYPHPYYWASFQLTGSVK